MSRRANPAVVGGFVVGALVLLIAGVLVFGSGALLRERFPVVAFFSGNVRGLQPGSSVEFRGVRVGTVTDIQLALDVESNELLIPVYMELEPQSLTLLGNADGTRDATAAPFLDGLVAKGLRARLDLKSFVTGQLAVGLDMHPETAAKRVGAITAVYELPTVPSTLDQVAEVLRGLPLQDIAVKLIDTLDNVGRLLGSSDLTDAVRDTASAAAHTRSLISGLEASIGPTVDEVRAVLRETRQTLPAIGQRAGETLEEYARLSREVGRRVSSLSDSLEKTLAEISGIGARLDARIAPVSTAAVKTLEQAESALAGARDLVSGDSRTRYNLDVTLEELAAAARSLRLMADYLVQNPDALIKGKGL